MPTTLTQKMHRQNSSDRIDAGAVGEYIEPNHFPSTSAYTLYKRQR